MEKPDIKKFEDLLKESSESRSTEELVVKLEADERSKPFKKTIEEARKMPLGEAILHIFKAILNALQPKDVKTGLDSDQVKKGAEITDMGKLEESESIAITYVVSMFARSLPPEERDEFGAALKAALEQREAENKSKQQTNKLDDVLSQGSKELTSGLQGVSIEKVGKRPEHPKKLQEKAHGKIDGNYSEMLRGSKADPFKRGDRIR